jgi:hypothetical protein
MLASPDGLAGIIVRIRTGVLRVFGRGGADDGHTFLDADGPEPEGWSAETVA